MADTLWRGVVKSISEREGIDVTATVKRTGAGIEIAYSFDDPEQHDVEDPIWDAETAATIAERLTVVTTALHAHETLYSALLRAGTVWVDKICGKPSSDPGAAIALEQAQVAYDKAMAALPKALS